MLALSVMAAVGGANAATYTVDTTLRERQKFCVHGIIGARQTGASNEHEHQTQFSQEVHQPPR